MCAWPNVWIYGTCKKHGCVETNKAKYKKNIMYRCMLSCMHHHKYANWLAQVHTLWQRIANVTLPLPLHSSKIDTQTNRCWAIQTTEPSKLTNVGTTSEEVKWAGLSSGICSCSQQSKPRRRVCIWTCYARKRGLHTLACATHLGTTDETTTQKNHACTNGNANGKE